MPVSRTFAHFCCLDDFSGKSNIVPNSRIDAFHGHAEIFNQEAFDETLSYYGDTVNVESGAAAIVARMKTCKSTNPTYIISDLGESFILGETAAFISILGDAETITANKTLVKYLFGKLIIDVKLLCLPADTGKKTNDSPPSWAGRGRKLHLRRTSCWLVWRRSDWSMRSC